MLEQEAEESSDDSNSSSDSDSEEEEEGEEEGETVGTVYELATDVRWIHEFISIYHRLPFYSLKRPL